MTFGALSQIDILLLALIGFSTACFHSIAGFSGGLLLAIAVAPFVGIKETVPTVSVAMLISNIARVNIFRRSIDWPIYLTINAVALPFVVLGIFMYLRMPTHYVAMFLGVFLMTMVPARWWLEGQRVRVSLKSLGVIAVPYGFLSGTSFGVGLMLAPFLLGAGLAGEALVATAAATGLSLNLTKTVFFGLSPLLTAQLALIGAMIGACTIPGHYLGAWIVRRTSLRVHARIVEAIIVAGALYYIWKGFATWPAA
ncbi:MAG: sulfite exporter TauE/SafE family protein [Hyphomicrobiaceae bacterium]